MSSAPIKVLLVDDDEDDFIIARDLLAEIGPTAYKVDWINNFDQALDVMVCNTCDVCLVDYHLGAHNGLELIREAHARGSRTPVIFLTGLGDDAIDNEAMKAGAEDFLNKGQITAKTLERSIRYTVQRSRAEIKIQKLAAFPRANPNPVFEFDADGAMTYCNDAAFKLASFLGEKSPSSVLPADCSDVVKQCLWSGENRLNLQTSLRHRTLSWSFIPIATSRTVHCFATDITERLELEAQLRHSVKMEAVGQLAAGVAHDFNNILTIIQGHADLLAREAEAESENQRALLQICTAAERAGNLIRQLLMFSRKQILQPRQLDLNETVSNVAKMVQRLIGEQIKFEMFPSPDLPGVYADIGMMEQALVNLAINARDAMPNGGTIIVSTSEKWFEPVASPMNPEARSGHFVALSVKDTGCGMDEETLTHIFEPFFTTKAVGKGTGLGLATVYGIVKQHKGWIVVESQAATGSTFTIFLPCLPRPVEKFPAQPAASVQAADKTETILVVEDESALRELVVSILELHGYRTYQAENGVVALKVWEEHKDEIDLLLTDMVMPEGISGRHLARLLHEKDPDLKVIYTSGYSPGMAGQDIALMEGFNFLAKPYPPSRLVHMLRQRLNSDDSKKKE